MTRKTFEVADSFDAGNRVVCADRAIGYRAECGFAVGQLQVAKRFCVLFKLTYGCL